MATVPTPSTQVAGTAVPAATINSQGNLATYLAGRTESGGARRPLCVARQTVAQSLANATDTPLNFDAEDVDYDNGHSTVTNNSRYTVGTQGWYNVIGIAAFAPNTTGTRRVYIRVNGSPVPSTGAIANAATGGDSTHLVTTRPVFLNATDFVEIGVFQNSTAALNTAAGTSQYASAMVVHWISA